METVKAGCFLINKEQRTLALVYRQKRNDVSFPKGHKEQGESIQDCAIRETAEETKRVANIVKEVEPYVERYSTDKGEKCVCYMYYAFDNGPSDNDSLDTHDVLWIDFDKVEQALTYPSQKQVWNEIKSTVYKITEN